MKNKKKKLIWPILFITISIILVGCNTLPKTIEQPSLIVPSLIVPLGPVLDIIPSDATTSETLAISNKNNIKLVSYIEQLMTFIEGQDTYYQNTINLIIKE